MSQTVTAVFEASRIADFWLAAYLIFVIAVLLIAFGIFFITHEHLNNHIGTALIVAACLLLAFTAIIGFSVYNA